jgi:hypothetical protein
MYTSQPSDNGMVRAEPRSDGFGCVLIDDIQGVCTHLQTTLPARLESYDTDAFYIPLDSAYRLDTAAVRIPKRVAVFIRDADGQLIEEISSQDDVMFPDGEYTIELGGLDIKTYIRVTGRVSVNSCEDSGTRIHGLDTDHLGLGLRSFHEFPAVTVTTTDEPRDIMRAVSCLGSALKTTSCERSFPTLRGHPPKIEVGTRFDAPSGVERTPETASVTIEVPPELSSVYPVAPLAYYLDAALVPGSEPRLVADSVTHSLDGEDGFEARVARILQHVFTLDCITRTEGFYPVQLGERDMFERRIDTNTDSDINSNSNSNSDFNFDLDFTDLYQHSLPELVNTYLSIPFEALDGIRPRWPLTADVVPESEYLSYIPYAVHDLCTIRCPSRSVQTDIDPVEQEAIEDFYRGPTAPLSRSPDSPLDSDQRGTDPSSPDVPNVFKPEATDSVTHLWIGDGYPILAAKPTLESSQRRLEATPSGSIEVAVVSNAAEMRDESDVAQLYGLRELVSFDVDVYEDLTRDELREVWADNYDLLHFVGHVTDDGLQCNDGWLDTETLEQVNVRAFILNGCRSFEQGMGLIDAGAISGLCTLSRVGNTPATRIGRTVARLLNAGFSLGGALDIIKDELITARRYMIVGDPRVAIAESRGPVPILGELNRVDSSMFNISIYGYQSSQARIAGIYTPFIPDHPSYYLGSGYMGDYSIEHDELLEYLDLERYPVRVNGSLIWSDNFTPDDLSSI